VERARKGDGQSAVAAKPVHAEEIYPGLRVMQSEVVGAVRRPPTSPAPMDGLPFAMPIPEDIAALRRADRALSLEWRYFVRNTLEQAFAAGYTMVDCLHVAGSDWCYILKANAG
jgi:predicted GNAT superfamily acetyltransferase